MAVEVEEGEKLFPLALDQGLYGIARRLYHSIWQMVKSI